MILKLEFFTHCLIANFLEHLNCQLMLLKVQSRTIFDSLLRLLNIWLQASFEIFYLQTFKFMLYLFMSMHYFGCLFYWLADNYPPIVSARDSAHAQETQGSTWISNLEKRFPPFVVAQSTLSEKYLICECPFLVSSALHSFRHRSPV